MYKHKEKHDFLRVYLFPALRYTTKGEVVPARTSADQNTQNEGRPQLCDGLRLGVLSHNTEHLVITYTAICVVAILEIVYIDIF